MAAIGLSFSPFESNRPGSAGASDRGTVSPVQDAIKVLSFRQPTILGSQAPVPQAIFGGAGPTAQGAQLGGSLAENWLRMLFGGQGMGQPTPFRMPTGFEPQTTTGMGGFGPMGMPPPSSALPVSVSLGITAPEGRSPDMATDWASSPPSLPSGSLGGIGYGERSRV